MYNFKITVSEMGKVKEIELVRAGLSKRAAAEVAIKDCAKFWNVLKVEG